MQLLFPRNIFASLIVNHLSPDVSEDISFHPSAILSGELEKNSESVGLIPAIDLINHKDLYVSTKYGLSFEGSLCNTYLYYSPDQKEIKDIYLYGDISSQEAILSKIIFKELYDAAIEVHLLRDDNISNKNLIIAGDQNFIDSKFVRGLSFADEVTDNLNLPYINYVFASVNKELIDTFNKKAGELGENIYNDVEKYNFGSELPELSKDYIKSSIASLVTDFDPQDIEGLEQLLRMPYFYGMIENIVDIKYI